jgi:alcohol dehydrogenase
MDIGKQFCYRRQPTEILFGYGVLNQLGERITQFNMSRVFVVTDRGLVKAGIADRLITVLKKSEVDTVLFSETHEDPGTNVVAKAKNIADSENCDTIIGLGGGSCIDAAKAVSILLNNPDKLTDYGGMDKVPNPCLHPPIIAIPTTAGTGSEVTMDAVITDDENGEKFFIASSNICPSLALVDPELTITLPAFITATTGMDALTHAIESFTNLITQPISQSIAFSAIKLIGKSLRQAVNKGQDKHARYSMSLASLMAGMSFTVARLGLCHAIYLPLGSKPYKIAHGLANGMMLSHVMKFNARANPKGYRRVAQALGFDDQSLSDLEVALKSAEEVAHLARDIGMERKLGEFGITEADLPQIAKGAFRSGGIKINPRPVTQEDIIQICREAL